MTRINAEFGAMGGADDFAAVLAQEPPRQPVQRHAEMGAGIDVDYGSIGAMHGEQAALRAFRRREAERGAGRQVGEGAEGAEAWLQR